MDIIDIILARAKSFTGETATLVQQAREAMAQANQVTELLEDAQQINASAQEALATAEEGAQQFNSYINDIETTTNDIISNRISELSDTLAIVDESTISNLAGILSNNFLLSKSTSTTNEAITTNVTLKLVDDNFTSVNSVVKNYRNIGDNEDGSMTQKAIKNYVQQQISSAVLGENVEINTNLGSENAGNIVIINKDGNIIASNISEDDLIELLLQTGIYEARNAIGVSIDYENKTINRTQESTDSTNFNNYIMYKGRMRCNVNDDGTITAFYGDNNYRDDGSNGQVMVYQPKFYYQRVPIATVNGRIGKIIRKESLIISPTQQSGFKLHPAFINENGEELDYILLSAYEGCAYDVSEGQYLNEDNSGIDFSSDKLSSVANVKPISGEKNSLRIDNAEKLATNRGEGWHISTMQTCSLDQMLLLVEYNTLNIQDAIEKGVSYLENSYMYNRANQTGSTASLGNTTGAASSSINITHGNTNTYSTAGQRSISYRGEENPFGNIWKFIGNVNINGNGNMNGGMPYICKNYNYNHTSITNNYESVGFCITNNSDWISGMGYGEEKYDWVFLPAEASGANSATPVGDSIWVTSNLNGTNVMSFGGTWLFQQKDGIFYYACDKDASNFAAPFSARLIYIPRKNTIYNNNIALWQSKIGG